MKTPDFTFEIKGITLDMCDMNRIKEQYEIYCTAEYLIENYHFEEEKALKLAADVRRLMFKYGYDEDEAIVELVGYIDEAKIEKMKATYEYIRSKLNEKNN